MTDELEIVRDVTERLKTLDISFMLTGSMAMNFYAQPRMTRDVDIVIALREEDAERFAAAFNPDYYADEDIIRDAVRRRSMFNLIHQGRIIKVDMVIRKNDAYRLAEFERRRQARIDRFDTWIVSKEDLILSKLVWARESQSESQMRDIRNLLGTGADEAYLRHWAEHLQVTPMLEACRA
jgi:hypothetical protein